MLFLKGNKLGYEVSSGVNEMVDFEQHTVD